MSEATTPTTLDPLAILAAKRAVEGYFAQLGAVNPGALLRSMVRMMEEDPTLGFDKLKADPGLRQVLHQLAYLVFEGGSIDLNRTYRQDSEVCREAFERRNDVPA